MVNFALGFQDEVGTSKQVLAVPVSLGYDSIVFLDENGAPLEIENSPAESPPGGESVWMDEDGNVVLVPYAILNAQGDGPTISLPSFVGTIITDRWRMVQFGDHSQIEFPLSDARGPLDLTGALLLEAKIRRPDHTLLTKAGTAPVPVDGKLLVQLDTGDVNGAGDWLMQAHVVLAGGREFHGEVRRVKVEANA